MNKSQVLIILFLIAGISACKKDTVEYPITYSSYSISDPIIKVYTKNGEVTSSVLINNFVSHYQYHLNKLESDKIKGQIVASYLSADSVELTIDNIKENKRRAVRETSGITYWEKPAISMIGIGPIFKVEDLYKYHPLYYNETSAPPGSAYVKYANLKECYFTIQTGGKPNIPMFDFLWIDDGRLAQVDSQINNSFKKEGLVNFLANDTMMIRSYSIEMR